MDMLVSRQAQGRVSCTSVQGSLQQFFTWQTNMCISCDGIQDTSRVCVRFQKEPGHFQQNRAGQDDDVCRPHEGHPARSMKLQQSLSCLPC